MKTIKKTGNIDYCIDNNPSTIKYLDIRDKNNFKYGISIYFTIKTDQNILLFFENTSIFI